MSIDDAWMTVGEAARYLRLDRTTLYGYMQRGLLPFYELRSGGGRRLRRRDLDALLELGQANQDVGGEGRPDSR